MGAVIGILREGRDSVLTEERKQTVCFKIANGIFCLAAVLFFLYFFLLGLALMGDAFKVLTGDSAGTLFSAVSNPVAGLMVGILATVLVQSSSTTTSIIVAAVGSGALSVEDAVPMIFGANIGTSVTNTIVSVGFAGDVKNYERAFAGATVHDLFNYLNVCLWFPLELIVAAANPNGTGGPLALLSGAIADSFESCDAEVRDCEKWTGPLKVITSAVSKKIISVDKDVITDLSKGAPSADKCEFLCDTAKCIYKFKRKHCSESPLALPETVCGNVIDGEEVSSKTPAQFLFCLYNETSGAITVDEEVLAAAVTHYESYKLYKGGMFPSHYEKAAGGITLGLSIIILIICLMGLVKALNYIVAGTAERMVKRALDAPGIVAIVVGAAVTIFVQSSSITTSVLTPLVAIGVLSVEKMLPFTLGANIGTTVTGVLAAMVSNSAQGFQIALVHVFFNVFGVLIFYPIPFIRRIPINGAKSLGSAAAAFRPFPAIYIIMAFLVYPGILLGISLGYETGYAGAIIGVTFLLVFLIGVHVCAIYWFKRRGGKAIIMKWIARRNLDLQDDDDNNTGGDGGNVDAEKGEARADSDDQPSSDSAGDAADADDVTLGEPTGDKNNARVQVM